MRTSGFSKNIYSAAVRRYQYFIKVFASRLKNRSETFLDEKTFAGTASAGSEALPEDKRLFEKRFFIPFHSSNNMSKSPIAAALSTIGTALGTTHGS